MGITIHLYTHGYDSDRSRLRQSGAISILNVRKGVVDTVQMGDANVESIPIPDIPSLESGRKAQMAKSGAPERAVQNDVFASF